MKTKNLIFMALQISLVLLISCEKESPIHETGDVSSTALQLPFESAFTLTGFVDPTGIMKDNLVIDWNSETKDSINGKLWHEFKVSEKMPMRYEDGKTLAYNYTLLAHREETGKITFYLTKILSYGDGREHAYFGLEKDFFHGMAYLYNMEGGTDYFMHYQKGRVVFAAGDAAIGNERRNINPLYGKLCMEKANLSARCDNDALACMLSGGNDSASCGGSGPGSGYAQVRIQSWTEWYNVRPGGAMELNHIQNHADRYEWQWVPGATTTGSAGLVETNANYAVQGLGGSVNYSSTPPKNVVVSPTKIILDVSMKKTKALCVYNKLLRTMLDKHNLMTETWIAFSDDLNFERWDYTIKTEPDLRVGGVIVNAVTNRSRNVSRSIETTINSSQLENRSSIEVARTILHESLHALLIRHQRGIAATSFKDIFSDYIKKFRGVELHHKIIEDNYIIPMANALKQFDNNKGNDFSYYMDLAWGGFPDILSKEQQEKADKAQLKARTLGLQCD